MSGIWSSTASGGSAANSIVASADLYGDVYPALHYHLHHVHHLPGAFSYSAATDDRTVVGFDGKLKYVEANRPRFEFDLDGACKGLLIERQDTNYIPHSEDATGWTISGEGAVTDVADIDGVGMIQYAITTGTPESFWRTNQTTTLTTVQDDIFYISLLLASNTKDTTAISIRDVTNSLISRIKYSSSSGLVESEFATFVDLLDSSVETVGSLTRIKLKVQQVSANAANSITVGIGAGTDNDTSTTIVFGGVSVTKYDTSYVKTTTAAVTRLPDVVVSQDFSQFNESEGTIVCEFELKDLEPQAIYRLDDETTSNYIILALSFTALIATVVVGGVTQASINLGVVEAGVKYRASIGFKQNDFAASVNGGSVVTDSLGSIPSGLSRFKLGSYFGSGSIGVNMSGYIRDIIYYPRRVSNTLIQEYSKL